MRGVALDYRATSADSDSNRYRTAKALQSAEAPISESVSSFDRHGCLAVSSPPLYEPLTTSTTATSNEHSLRSPRNHNHNLQLSPTTDPASTPPTHETRLDPTPETTRELTYPTRTRQHPDYRISMSIIQVRQVLFPLDSKYACDQISCVSVTPRRRLFSVTFRVSSKLTKPLTGTKYATNETSPLTSNFVSQKST